VAINKQVIKDIRLRKTAQELESALQFSERVSHQLLQLSGVLNRVSIPAKLMTSPDERSKLLELANIIEKEEAMMDTKPSQIQTSRKQV
jgi:hypothetical protein